MKTEQYNLFTHATGTQRNLTTFHYGQPGKGKKCYIQAGLHASEIPGMLVSHYLKQALDKAESENKIHGEIVLVPVANPIGLDQTLLSYQIGRFDLSSGRNFNRGFPWVLDALSSAITDKLTENETQNTLIIRQTLKNILISPNPVSELASMQQRLSWLACDADIIIDLHCDSESVVHIYTHPVHMDIARQLGGLMRAKTILYTTLQGGESFDEAHVNHWIALTEKFPDYPISPSACAGFTLELRGQANVNHTLAREDASHLLDFLRLHNILSGSKPVVPQLEYEPSPLEGTEVLYAKSPGIIVYHKQCGEMCQPGDIVVDVINPLDNQCHTYTSTTKGILFARQNRRYATTGMDLAYIAGHEPLRQGMLLSA